MSNYLAWKKSYVTPGTYENYVRWNIRFRRVIKKDPLTFTLEDIGVFKDYLIKQGYAPKNIQYGLTIIKDYLGYLCTVEGLHFPLSLFKIQNERGVSHYALTEEEYEKLLKSVSNGDIQSIQRCLMLRMLWETGIRVGELLSIRIANLMPCRMYIENEKNKRSRMIAWSEETERLIQQYLKARNKVWTDSDCLFVSLGYKKKIGVMTSRNIQRIMIELTKEAGLSNKISPHSFRHGFVHRQLAAGKPVTTVAQMLGHSTPFNVLTYHQLSGIEVKQAWETVA